MTHPVFPVPATPAEAVRLLDAPLEALLDSAAALRERHHGKRISLCAIINARSGDCGMDCRFCSQSSHNHTPIAHFPFLEAAELRERILRLAAWPVRRIGIVTSGGALEEQELHCLLAVVRDLPEDVRRRVCTSLGRLPEKHLRELEQAGVRRYHHNLETSRAYYPRICSTQLWDQRRDTVLRAQATGLSVCAGGLFGLGVAALSFAATPLAFGLLYLALYLAFGIATTAQSVAINADSPPEVRATLLSGQGFALQIGGFAASLGASLFADRLGVPALWQWGAGLFLAGMLVTGMLLRGVRKTK